MTALLYPMHLAVMAGIFLVLAQSLNLVFGYCGLLSLATPGFLGIGAYGAALLARNFALDGLVTLPAAMALGALAGLLLGVPSLRLSRHSFVIVTLSGTLLLQLAATNWPELTNGALGLADIPALRLAGVAIDSKAAWCAVMLVLAAAVTAAMAGIVSSRAGRAMIAVRDNEALATAAGIDAMRTRMFAFACSGAVAALGGACYAHYVSFIDPGVFGFSFSETLLVMVILGGAGTVWGPVLGAIAFTLLPELLRVRPEIMALLYGLMLFAGIMLLPRGFAGWIGGRRNRVQ